MISVLLSIVALFLIILLLKEALPTKMQGNICALCLAVVITWVSYLILYWWGLFQNKIIIALLMGNSMLGLFYLVEKSVPASWKIFRLPAYLTMLFLALLILGEQELPAMGILIGMLWIIFFVLFYGQGNSRFRSWSEKIIKCCKNW